MVPILGGDSTGNCCKESELFAIRSATTFNAPKVPPFIPILFAGKESCDVGRGPSNEAVLGFAAVVVDIRTVLFSQAEPWPVPAFFSKETDGMIRTVKNFPTKTEDYQRTVFPALSNSFGSSRS